MTFYYIKYYKFIYQQLLLLNSILYIVYIVTIQDVYSGSHVGSFSTNVDQVKISVENCSFQLTNIVFTSSVQNHVSNSIQLYNTSTTLLDVIVVNSETSGFSYVNGVRLGSSPELKTQEAALIWSRKQDAE
ncbi:Hypothetical_protein [Hexamita inflata]|uniref:Hypothetical_protein n=1 Tax=Hexamita inflata TaxID=28002 RepID=A0AA86R295_9EUKA|nr:Hypothetical protein HINF_LOCUS56630 [Hexamita inflata]